MVDPIAIVREPQIGRQLGEAERLAEPRPLPFRANGDGDRMIGRVVMRYWPLDQIEMYP